MLSQQSQEGLRNLAPGAKSVGKTGGRSGWFRIGVASAALGAPLIARWNDLRTRQRLEAMRDQASDRLSDLSANAQATLGDRWDGARKTAQSLVAQNQPRAKAAIETARTLVKQNQPRAKAALETVRSATSTATDAARDLAQATAKRVAKGRGQLADVADASKSLAIKTRANSKASAIKTVANARVAQIAVKRNVRRNTTLWLAGIGVGVAVAGVAAYIVMRRRMTNATENDSLVELRMSQGVLLEDDDAHAFNRAQMDHRVGSASGATAGTTATAPASAMANSVANASDLAAAPDPSALLDDDDDEPDAVLIIETAMDDGAPSDALTDDLGYDDDDDDDDDGMSAATDEATNGAHSTRADYIDSPEVANNPAFIGNIHTMIYHPADADTLPAEDNQIFFATEQQAIAAGYRRTKRERVGANGDNDEDTAGK